MTNIRKGLAILLATITLLAPSLSTVKAQPQGIYEKVTKQTITSGAELQNIVRFTESGWLNINVLTIDLTNPNIKVDTLSSQNSLKKLSSVKNLAKSSGAVAAINSSFFSSSGGGNGNAIGSIMQSGQMMSASSDFNYYSDSMGTFSIDNMNQLFYNYWKTQITLIAPSGESKLIAHYNKPSTKKYVDYCIYDRKYCDMSVGASVTYPDIVEMVVISGKVVEIRQGLPAIPIPQDGYVVVTRAEGAKYLLNSFPLDSTASFSIITTPDWQNLKMAVTGSSVVLKEGAIPVEFSHKDPSLTLRRHPRTLVGSSKDGTKLMLVTVDGRQTASIGMTMKESAEFMLEIGAFNALNLDGGGSTTIAARKPGTQDVGVANRPSDGTSRLVSNAIGVFSLAPQSELAGMIIDTEDINMFVNGTRAFTVRGYDKYFNPVEIKPEDIKWDISYLKGSFNGNIFHATSFGEGIVTATVGDIKASLQISSLSPPARLVINTKSVNLPINASKSFSLYGFNKNGYGATISPEDVKWSVSGKLGIFSNNKLTATTTGVGYIKGTVGTASAYCSISVALNKSTVKDTFEKENGSFSVYPSTVTGKYEISTEQKHGGKTSGKLTYDFVASDETRATYLNFSDNGVPLSLNAVTLGVWVYNDHTNSNWLRGEVIDGTGTKNTIEFCQTMEWEGWKYVEANLQSIKQPVSLASIYLVQPNPIADAGSIYLDDLTMVTTTYPKVDPNKIPKDTVPKDDANKAVSYSKNSTSFRFGVFGLDKEPENNLQKKLISALASKVNKYFDIAALVGSVPTKFSYGFKKPFVATAKGFKSIDVKNARFIQLDTSNSSIRKTDPKQWKWLFQQLDTAKGKHIFIYMDKSPENFTDGPESKLFEDYLTEYKKKSKKNVWVIYKGNDNSSYMKRGIKYITSAGFDVAGLTSKKPSVCKYLMITVKGDNAYYEFRPII